MTAKKTIWFIVNPISGISSKQAILRRINKLIDKKRFDIKILMTEYAGHGAVLATMAAENGIDIVVAIGGDGTINEIARSLVNTDTIMGIIPCGSGNGLARHLQIPLDYTKAIHLINDLQYIKIDYGKINKKPFFCTCGMGFDASVSFKFLNSSKRGVLTYIDNALQALINYKPETYIIEDEEGKHRYKAFLITCANASQYGNNIYIAPHASMSDGLMDITIIEPFTVVDIPQIAYQLFSGKMSGSDKIKTFRAKKITIIREKEGIIHCDGDPRADKKTLNVEIFPKALKIIINPNSQEGIMPLSQTIATAFNNFYQIEDYFSLYKKKTNKFSQNIKQLNKDILNKLHKM